nr:Gnt-I system [Klebsiella pneumoniae]
MFARFLKGIDKPIPEGLHNPKVFTEEEMRALASASGPRWFR